MGSSGSHLSDNNLLLKISSKYIIEFIISHLESNIYYKIIKYNKKFHQKMNINLEQSLINYIYKIRTKNNIVHEKNGDVQNQISKTNSYKKYYKYLKFIQNDKNLNLTEESDIFLLKYKEFKINDFPLPSNFNKVKLKEKLLILENKASFFKYTLNDKEIELIYLINELRENNNLNKLICNKIQDLNDFFREKNSNNNKYLFVYPFGEFKNILLTKDKRITKILLIKELKYIIILEKELNEYIFIYSDKNHQLVLNIDKKPLNFDKFFLVNNTIPIIDTNNSIELFKKHLKIRLLSNCFKNEGFQIFSFKKDTLIGLLEGPPRTSFQNGYFLFKIIFFDNYPLMPPKFVFISKMFHPNISEDGFVSIDVLEEQWSPALNDFNKIIYSVQSLLDDPNPEDFLNEKAAKIYKEDRNIYNKIVREYTSNFASYSKFLDEMNKMNLNIITIKNGEKFRCIYSEDK